MRSVSVQEEVHHQTSCSLSLSRRECYEQNDLNAHAYIPQSLWTNCKKASLTRATLIDYSKGLLQG